jgi:outer membrane biosynthesis protein TonB
MIHILLLLLITIPVFRSDEAAELLYNGLVINFNVESDDAPTSPAIAPNQIKTPNKKAAETNSELTKSAPSNDQHDAKAASVEKKSKSINKTMEKTSSPLKEADRMKNVETEKRRQFILEQLEKSAEELKNQELEAKRIEKLAQKARIKKYQEMKNAFSQILENASHETNDNSNFNLSTETISQESLSESSINSSVNTGLGNRKVLFIPDIQDQSQKEGRIVINICVNAKGDVISARYTQKGSTTTDPYLIDLAATSARLYKFSPANAPRQCGIVHIDFVVK